MYTLLTLLLPEGMNLQEVLNLDQSQESTGKDTPKNMSLPQLSTMDEEGKEMRPGEMAKLKEQQKRKDLYLEVRLLLQYYNEQTTAALVRCTRRSLDTIKRRVTSPSAIQYGDTTEERKKLDPRPALKVKLILAVPHVVLKPGLDEIQAVVNVAIKNVLAVHREVVQWGQRYTEEGAARMQGISPGGFQAQLGVLGAPSGILNTHSGVLNAKLGVLEAHSGVLQAQSGVLGPSGILNAYSGVLNARSGVLDAQSEFLGTQSEPLSFASCLMATSGSWELRTFYRSVADHKEIAKLVSMMASTISSAKMLVAMSLEPYKRYKHLWVTDRTEHMKSFMAEMPSVLDFEAQMKDFAKLDDVISEEEDVRRCGTFALVTG